MLENLVDPGCRKVQTLLDSDKRNLDLLKLPIQTQVQTSLFRVQGEIA